MMHCWTPLLCFHFTPIFTTTLPMVITGCAVCHDTRKTRLMIYSKTNTVPSAWHLLQDRIKRKLLGINKQGEFL